MHEGVELRVAWFHASLGGAFPVIDMVVRPVVEFPSIHYRAAYGIAMSVDCFRGGIDDDIRAMLDWSEQVWRGQGVVHDDGDTVPVSDAGDQIEIGNPRGRVRHAFQEDKAGVGTDCRFKLLFVIDCIHIIHSYAERGEQIVNEIEGAAVQVAG